MTEKLKMGTLLQKNFNDKASFLPFLIYIFTMKYLLLVFK